MKREGMRTLETFFFLFLSLSLSLSRLCGCGDGRDARQTRIALMYHKGERRASTTYNTFASEKSCAMPQGTLARSFARSRGWQSIRRRKKEGGATPPGRAGREQRRIGRFQIKQSSLSQWNKAWRRRQKRKNCRQRVEAIYAVARRGQGWTEIGEIGVSRNAGKDLDCWNERCEHALPIWAKFQVLIYGAVQFVRAGYASVREKLYDTTRRD